MIVDFMARLNAIRDLPSKARIAKNTGRAKVHLPNPSSDVRTLTFCKGSANWIYKNTVPETKGRGVHEPGLMASLLALREMQADTPNRCFVDIGVLHGYVSLMAAAIGGFERVVGFEMNPRAARLTTRSIGLNPNLSANVSLVHAGMADHAEPAVPCLYKGFSLNVRPDEEARATLLEQGFQAADIDLMSIDAYVAEHGIVPTVIKIDVEGSQASILRGAENTLRAHRPVLLVEGDGEGSANYEGVSSEELCAHLTSTFDYDVVLMDHRRWRFNAFQWEPGTDGPSHPGWLMVFLPK